LTRLTNFTVQSNNLTGPIPTLNNNRSLQTFAAAQNRLTGNIPSLDALTGLNTFLCDNNSLSGSIPSLSSNKLLRSINVGDQRGIGFTGPIPNLSGLSNLQSFVCQKNQLTGPIPSLNALSSLQTFTCYTNQLTGSIPSLSGLGNLQTFFCYENQLTGSIPSLSGLGNLRNFSCYTNQLTGPIPSLNALSSLQNFSVYDNLLSDFNGGNFPSTLANFTAQNNQLTQTAVDNILLAAVNGGRGTIPMSNLHRWFDANDSATVLNSLSAPASNGEDIMTWQDKSGNSGHLTHQYGQAPILTTNALSGNSVARFTANGQFNGSQLRGTHSLGSGSVTYFVVYRWRNLHRTFPIDTLFTLGTEGGAGGQGGIGTDSTNDEFSLHGVTFNPGSVVLNRFNHLSLNFNSSNLQTNGYYNGVKVGATQTGNASSIDPYLILGSWIYNNGNSSEYFADADIAEVIIYNKSLSDLERLQVEGYINTKYYTTPIINLDGTGNAAPTLGQSNPSKLQLEARGWNIIVNS